jgi:hypothetical protein
MKNIKNKLSSVIMGHPLSIFTTKRYIVLFFVSVFITDFNLLISKLKSYGESTVSVT